MQDVTKEKSVDIDIFGATDIGKVRKVNQDSFTFDVDDRYLVVCDGIGGRKSGDVASKMAAEGLGEKIAKNGPISESNVSNFLSNSVDKVNKAIVKNGLADQAHEGMATTLNAIYFTDKRAYVAHLGDSRTYLYYEDNLWQLTFDHNVKNYVEKGWLSKDALVKNSKPDALVRAIGLTEQCDIDVYELDLKEEFILITCSDGLTGMVDDSTIKDIVSRYTEKLHVLPGRLIKEANDNGGMDNITVVVSRVRSAA